ncbi:hypothetical protein ELAN_17450 [Elizabethkingia anophelis]|uniref:beta-propeller fold lactonase family protein n=1 Tax=Elizabethkingia anophelis TaxID=1117645 RepID=UPI0023E97B82|nr:hypothetical protein ELAN_17450 [Elizabethkingia anophelis]
MKFKLIAVLTVAVFASVHLYSQNTYVFFGSFNWHKKAEGLYVYQLNINSGKLTKVTSVKGILNPSYLTLSPDGKYVFACVQKVKPKRPGV